MKTNIQRWGNSLGIRIPHTIIKRFSLHPGITLEIKVEDDQIILYPKKFSLADMLAQITEDNMPSVEFPDDTRGGEEW